MKRIGIVGLLLAPMLVACPVDDAGCFGNDECPTGQTCVGSQCVGPSSGRDGGDVGDHDAGPRDGGPGGGMDGGRDAGPDGGRDGGGGCPEHPLATFGRALEDGQYGFGDRILMHLDETTAPFSDTSGGGHMATCVGTQCPTPETCGVYGGAMAFDGVDDRLTITAPTQNFGITGAFYGAELWFKAEPTNTSTQCLFEYEDKFGQFLRAVLLPDNRIQIHTGTISATRDLRNGAWWHLAVTRGFSSEVYVILDLEDVLGDQDMGFVGEPVRIELGRCSDGRHFEGLMDEFRLGTQFLHPESDVSRSPADVRVAWEHGADIHVGSERLTSSRAFATDAIYPAFSSDGDTVAYLKCGTLADSCDLYARGFSPGSAEAQLTTSGDLGRARVSFLDSRRIYYTRGAACSREVMYYDVAATDHTTVMTAGPYGSLDVGRVAENTRTESALYVIREDCGAGDNGVLRIDDPLVLSGAPSPVEVYTLTSSVSVVVDVRPMPTFDPFQNGFVYIGIEDADGSFRTIESFWNGPLETEIPFNGTFGGRDLAMGYFPPYFYYAAVPAGPFDHSDEARLEIHLLNFNDGATQRLTTDSVPSRHPAAWYSYP